MKQVTKKCWRKFMAVSMDDVARESGVSKATVSRVLSMKSGVANKSRKKVIDACEKLGYQLNFSIQDFVLKNKSGNTKQLALVMIDEPFNSSPYLSTINDLITVVNQSRYHLSFVHITSESCNSLYDLPAELRDKRVDGMFFLGSFPKKLAKILLQLDLPGVVIGCFEEGVCEGFCNIHSDFHAKVRKSLQKLIQLGASKIAYVEESISLTSDVKMYEAFKDTYKTLLGDIDESLHYVSKVKLAGILELMTPIFMKKELPFDAVYCPDERIAIEIDKLNFMHSKLFSVQEIPVAASWCSHDSVLKNVLVPENKNEIGTFAMNVIEDMIEKRPFPRKVIL